MRIVIIGNGIAGITAAITIRRLSGHAVTVVSGESAHFYARTALMYLYLGQLKYEQLKGYEDWFWEENNITLKHAWANGIDFRGKTVTLASGENLPYDKLLLATGSQTNFYNWPGQELKGVHGLYNLQDLEKIEAATATCTEAVIVGAGLVGIELAEMLHARGIKVTILIRDEWYWGSNLPEPEARMIEKELVRNGISFRLKTGLKEVTGDKTGTVRGAITTEDELLSCTFLGITTGVTPNLDLANTTDLKIRRGIVVNEFLETSQPDVYAAGDCAELAFAHGRVEQLWYTGRLQGETVGHNICGDRKSYQRGIPFNSAKFFALEFQSYGLVNAAEDYTNGSFFWQHSSKSISIRVNYVKDERRTVNGFVLMGTRFRQEVCETWIRERKPMAEVLNNLHFAFFDPELKPQFKKEVLRLYKNQNPLFEIKNQPAKRFSWF